MVEGSHRLVDVLRTELGAGAVTVFEGHRLPFREQMAVFQRARLIVGAHGAGLTNAIFASPASSGTPAATLVELPLRNAPTYAYFGHIAAAVGLDYWVLPGMNSSYTGSVVVTDEAVDDFRAFLRLWKSEFDANSRSSKNKGGGKAKEAKEAKEEEPKEKEEEVIVDSPMMTTWKAFVLCLDLVKRASTSNDGNHLTRALRKTTHVRRHLSAALLTKALRALLPDADAQTCVGYVESAAAAAAAAAPVADVDMGDAAAGKEDEKKEEDEEKKPQQEEVFDLPESLTKEGGAPAEVKAYLMMLCVAGLLPHAGLADQAFAGANALVEFCTANSSTVMLRLHAKAITYQARCNEQRGLTEDMRRWGEDMILSDPSLRRAEPGRAITFVEVYTLHSDNLETSLQQYRGEAKRIRFHRIWLAFTRRFLAYARETRLVLDLLGARLLEAEQTGLKPVDLFEAFDKDNSGTIDRVEFKGVLDLVGFTPSPTVFEGLVNLFMLEGSGDAMAEEIDYDGFVRFFERRDKVNLSVAEIMNNYNKRRGSGLLKFMQDSEDSLVVEASKSKEQLNPILDALREIKESGGPEKLAEKDRVALTKSASMRFKRATGRAMSSDVEAALAKLAGIDDTASGGGSSSMMMVQRTESASSVRSTMVSVLPSKNHSIEVAEAAAGKPRGAAAIGRAATLELEDFEDQQQDGTGGMAAGGGAGGGAGGEGGAGSTIRRGGGGGGPQVSFADKGRQGQPSVAVPSASVNRLEKMLARVLDEMGDLKAQNQSLQAQVQQLSATVKQQYQHQQQALRKQQPLWKQPPQPRPFPVSNPIITETTNIFPLIDKRDALGNSASPIMRLASSPSGRLGSGRERGGAGAGFGFGGGTSGGGGGVGGGVVRMDKVDRVEFV
eukprot:g1788.t1